MTLQKIIREIIYEEAQKTLKVFYNIDIEIKPEEPKPEEPKTEEVPTEEVPTEEVPTEEVPTEESASHKGSLLLEEVYKNKISGSIVVPAEKAANIQTIDDLVGFLSGEYHQEERHKSSMEKVLNKEKTKVKSGKIISQAAQDLILILSGSAGEQSSVGDLVGKGDKIIIEISYGSNETDNVGLKINKNAGSEVISTTIIKDGKVLSGKFDSAIINKQILFYRNSLVS